MATKGTNLYVPDWLDLWIRQEAERRGMKIARYLAQVTACPETFREERQKKHGRGRPRGEHGVYRGYLRDLILVTLSGSPRGEARASEVLTKVKEMAQKQPGLPADWMEPPKQGGYGSRLELYAAFEKKNALSQGLLAHTPRGVWGLSAAGKAEAARIIAAGGPRPITHKK
jgi:hypothetical protein